MQSSAPKIKDKFSNLDLPSIESMQIQLEELVNQGTLSPEDAQAILLERSAMEGVQSDQTTKQAQLDALMALQGITEGGGLNATDRFQLNQIRDAEQTAERGAREAIMQNAAQRGLAGSGLELMSSLKNQQDSATRQSQRDLGVAAMAQQRALEALMNQGQLAGSMNQQDFAQQAQKAAAMDAIAQFNAANRQNVEMQNVGARNQAQQYNLGQKQGIADANVNLRNQQQQYNKNLIQQNFNNEMAKRSGQQQVAAQNAQIQGQNSAQNAGFVNNLVGTGITAAATAYGGPAGGMTAAQLLKAMNEQKQQG